VSTHAARIYLRISHTIRIHNIIPCNDTELRVLILENLHIYIYIYYIRVRRDLYILSFRRVKKPVYTVRQHIRRRRWKSRNFYALVYIFIIMFLRSGAPVSKMCVKFFHSFFINIILRVRRWRRIYYRYCYIIYEYIGVFYLTGELNFIARSNHLRLAG